MSGSSRSSTDVLIAPATSYAPAADLAVVTSYFNSHHYDSKRRAFDLFAHSMDRSGIPLFVGECAFGDSPFELEESASVFRFRARDVLWQKERLLNLVIERVPDRYSKIAWIDADILFENPRWAIDASEQLDELAVVQLFDRAIRLRPEETADSGGPRMWSYGFVHATLPAFTHFGEGNLHGTTGLAWAADRQLLQTVELYDAAIAGGADDLMAHAFSGDFSGRCLPLILTAGMVEHFRDWAEHAWAAVGGRLGYVRGAAQHLWHGEDQNRGYVARFHELNRLGYDPFAHLQLDSGGLWAFTDAGSRAVAEWTRAYFRERQEDTRAAAVPMVTGFGFSLSRPGAPGFDDELDEALERARTRLPGFDELTASERAGVLEAIVEIGPSRFDAVLAEVQLRSLRSPGEPSEWFDRMDSATVRGFYELSRWGWDLGRAQATAQTRYEAASGESFDALPDAVRAVLTFVVRDYGDRAVAFWHAVGGHRWAQAIDELEQLRRPHPARAEVELALRSVIEMGQLPDGRSPLRHQSK